MPNYRYSLHSEASLELKRKSRCQEEQIDMLHNTQQQKIPAGKQSSDNSHILLLTLLDDSPELATFDK